MLHFNDVYNIEERSTGGADTETSIVAGASRFVTAFEQHQMLEKLVLFSGDLFSPSVLSTHLKGEQMVQVLKSLNVHVSCLGNHDLDFGLAKMQELVKKTAPCKWLLSNLYADGQPIGGLDTWLVKEVKLSGAKD